MIENKRFKYVRNTYKHYIHDTEKDGEWKEGYIGTYGEFDLDKLTIELNKRENRINHLKNENEQLKKEVKELQGKASSWKITASEEMMKQSELMKENEQLKRQIGNLEHTRDFVGDVCADCNRLEQENEELKSENQRLTDKLNRTALELVDNCISQGKASEISEMSYNEFLDYRAENGKPMELRE